MCEVDQTVLRVMAIGGANSPEDALRSIRIVTDDEDMERGIRAAIDAAGADEPTLQRRYGIRGFHAIEAFLRKTPAELADESQ